MGDQGGDLARAAAGPLGRGLEQERITKALAGTLRADRLKGIATDQLDVSPAPDREGLTIATGSGESEADPALRGLSDARAQAARPLEAFGLSRRGRQVIDALPPSPVENPHTAFVKPMSSPR